MTASVSASSSNLLLRTFVPDVREALLAGSRTRSVAPGEILVNVGDAVSEVFFPTSGTLSVLAVPDTETTVEASSIGSEGAADVFAALGSLGAAQQLIGQVPAVVTVVGAKRMREHATQDGDAQKLLFSYMHALYAQTAASAACNAKHSTNERAARWLLRTHDQVQTDSIELRRDFFAAMLGVAPSDAASAADALKNAGLIDHSPDTITIQDRPGLESVACSCYAYISKQYSTLLEF